MIGHCTTCSRSGRIRNGLCDAHYFRLRRNGSVGKVEVSEKHPGAICSIDDCGNIHDSRGLCSKHRTRVARHGNPSIVLASIKRWGSENATWKGADGTYTSVHQRLYRRRGRAKDLKCIGEGCSNQASEWAYDHSDENEKISLVGTSIGSAYSLDVNKYVPLCHSCHRAFDADQRAITRRAINIALKRLMASHLDEYQEFILEELARQEATA